ERLLEAGRQLVRLGVEPDRQLGLATHRGESGHAALRVEDVALDFCQCDRWLALPAFAIADRVVRILPALIQQTAIRTPLVFDETVAVAVSVAIDPSQRGERVRPETVDQPAVPGPIERRTEEDQPQGRRIDRAVVGRVRQLAGARHLSGPQLVADLAWLRVACRVVLRRL